MSTRAIRGVGPWVQELFDAADGRVEAIRARGRKGAVAALRDAVRLKTIYAYGLRRREAVMPGAVCGHLDG